MTDRSALGALRSAGETGAYGLVSAVNRVTPKRHQALIFGFPDFPPNAVAVSNALIEHTDLAVVWLVSSEQRPPPLSMTQSERITFERHRSPQGILAYAQSKYVFTTHGIYGNRPAPRGQVVTQLWHAMPTKPIGALDGKHDLTGATWVIAASPFWRPIMADAFEVALEQVISTGMPRDEFLLRAPDPAIISAFDRLVESRPHSRVIVWLPTYRVSAVGDARVDGTEVGNAVQVPGFDAKLLNQSLLADDTLCIVKPHPMAPKSGDQDLSHLMFIDDAKLAGTGLDLYTLLSMSDGLATDLSSVWIDYLVTGKPILFVFPDIAEYRNTRGLTLEPYEQFIPGRLVTHAADLPQAIASLWEPDPARVDELERARKRLNSDSSSDSSRRLLQHLGLAAPPEQRA